MNLRFLYSTVPTLESIVGMVVTTSPSCNSHCLLLALLFPACCWPCYFQPLWVRSFPLWLLFSSPVGPLFCLLVTWIIRSTITAKFTESADSSSVLLRAVHHALRDVLVYRTLLFVLRVICWD